MITLLLLATILGADAVTFSSWLGEPCSGSPAIHEQTLEPYMCHSISIDNASSHASIKGWGLRNTNAKSGDFIELYLDADCQDRFSVLKHSGRCFTARHRSLKYFPPGQFPDEVCYLSFFSGESEVQVWRCFIKIVPEKTAEDLARDAEQQKADEELDKAMMRIEQAALIEDQLNWRAQMPSLPRW
jgi:hypothetical protein